MTTFMSIQPTPYSHDSNIMASKLNKLDWVAFQETSQWTILVHLVVRGNDNNCYIYIYISLQIIIVIYVNHRSFVLRLQINWLWIANYIWKLINFMSTFESCQIMTYLCLAAIASALQGALFAKLGEPTLQWMKVCTMYGKFCNQVGEGIASAVIASLSMVILSAISAFTLFRLYGNNKDKNNARW